MPNRQLRRRPVAARRAPQLRNAHRGRVKEPQRISIGALIALGGATGLFAGALFLAYGLPTIEPHIATYSTTATVSGTSNLSVIAKGSSASIGQPPNAPPVLTQIQFENCGSVRESCVVDGDTFWLNGVKVRLADIDTPEISLPKCDYEYQLGMKAKLRLLALLNEGPFEIQATGERDIDRYGRKLRVVVRNGNSIGDQLVVEGLARRWIGSRQPWC